MLTVTDLVIGYEGKALLGKISFSLEEGECVLLCGANGKGKSTLLKVLAGGEQPMEGRIEGEVKRVMVPTRIPKLKGFTAREFILASCYGQTDFWGRADRRLEPKIEEALDILGLAKLENRDISSLSDGEFQKLCTASALARDASVLMLDEPTAFLDVDSRITVLEALGTIADRRRAAVLFSSHDIAESSRMCSRILGISAEGRFLDSAECGKREVLQACFRNPGLSF